MHQIGQDAQWANEQAQVGMDIGVVHGGHGSQPLDDGQLEGGVAVEQCRGRLAKMAHLH